MSVVDDVKSLHADTLSAIASAPDTEALEKIRVEVVGSPDLLRAIFVRWAKSIRSIVPR